jgi:hypothetical protein
MYLKEIYKCKAPQFFLLCFVLINYAIKAQPNLVKNGDFEEYVNCPQNNKSLFTMPTHWYTVCVNSYNYGSGGAYGNSCANNTNSPNNGVPTSQVGYQYPRSGNGYLLSDYLFQNRGYLQSQLEDSMKRGKKYYCEFFISQADKLRNSCNNHGILFTKTAVYPDTISRSCGVLNLTPSVLPYGNPIITDTQHWVKLSGIYTAQGGEQFITLGNTLSDANTRYIRSYPSAPLNLAKYFIEDVSVIPLDSFCLKADAGADTAITIGDSVFVGSYTNGIDTIKWYNTVGQVIDSVAPGFWVKPTSNATYYVEQTVNGCLSRDTVTVTVQPLPLTMVQYQLLIVNEKQVMNNWHTANEINVSHYQIQRSVDSRNFETIGTVAAKNFASNEYSFVDELKAKDQLSKTLYYRIVGVDKDGKQTYSIIKSLELKVKSGDGISIYPNPVKDVINIVGKDIKEIKLLNTLGQVILQVSVKNEQAKLDVKDLSKGMYMLNIVTTKGGIINEKIIIQ